jgi:hypothetical protein
MRFPFFNARLNLTWQDYHLQAVQVQAALYRQGSLVMQQATRTWRRDSERLVGL